MKKLILLAVFALSACSTAQQQTATSTAAQAQKLLAVACPQVNAAIAQLSALQLPAQVQADLNAAAPIVQSACSVSGQVDPTSIKTLANTTIPAIIAAVQASGMSDTAKQDITISLDAASVALALL